MNPLFEIVAGILRGVVKAMLIALAALIALGVLGVGLLVVLVAVIRFLLTGRKPAVFATYTRFNQAAQQFRPGGSWAGSARVDDTHIVDVQAHEVQPVPAPLPPKTVE
jgi:hypothetical protein